MGKDSDDGQQRQQQGRSAQTSLFLAKALIFLSDRMRTAGKRTHRTNMATLVGARWARLLDLPSSRNAVTQTKATESANKM